MEQARYWMWSKRKHDDFGNHGLGDSWEEQAFAEDAAGPLGGCIWPPRSYSCSFCRREFKSAQALGGHMNVHRRDRARLKQSPNPHMPTTRVHSIPNPQICTFLYNPSTSDSEDHQLFLTTPSSPIRVSATPTKKDDCEYKPFLPLPPPQSRIFSSVIHEKRKSNMSSPQIQSWPKLVADKYFHVSELRNEDKSTSPTSESNGEYFKLADLSVKLNFICRSSHTNLWDDAAAADHDHATPSFKRRRIDQLDATSCTLFTTTSPHTELLNLMTPNSIEDLDLELRLGDPPKVK